MRILYAALISLVAGCSGCAGDDDTNSKNPIVVSSYKSHIIKPTGNTLVKSGEIITFVLKVEEYGKGSDTIVVWLDGREIYRSSEEIPMHELKLSSDTLRMGFHEFEAEFRDEKAGTEVNRAQFIVVSDIEPVQYSYVVKQKYPHDFTSYTQGLEFVNGRLFEGTGREGKSVLREVDLLTGKPLKEAKLDDQYFGEGITIFDNHIYQLTWSSRVGFVRNLATFEIEKQFAYQTQGWGMTHNDKYVIMSDGSEKLYFLDPETCEKMKELSVYDNRGPVIQLNELEFIDGEIWANIYLTDKIVRIDPVTGKVKGIINMSGLLQQSNPNGREDVLNGIAWESRQNKIYVTGKLWSALFEVEIVKKDI